MSLAWRWLLCKKAGSGGFGACFAEFSRKDGVVRLGHELNGNRKNQQLLVCYRPLAGLTEHRGARHDEPYDEVVAHAAVTTDSEQRAAQALRPSVACQQL